MYLPTETLFNASPNPSPSNLISRTAFVRYRYKSMWLSTRIIRTVEPLTVAAVCAWLFYGSREFAEGERVASAVIGFMLGASFLLSAFLLAAGLVWGGAWRELPTSLSWPIMHKLEAFHVFVHAAALSHWSYYVVRPVATPVFAMLFSIAYIMHASLIEPGHVAVTTFLLFTHHCALVAYDAMTTPGWSSATPAGSMRWVDVTVVMIVNSIIFSFVGYAAMPVIEAKRKEDFYVHTRTKLLQNVAHDLVVNFLPAPVMKAVQDRATHASPKDTLGNLLDDSEIVAWAYDPACVLQSDIVGFTALGSRVSPQELCR